MSKRYRNGQIKMWTSGGVRRTYRKDGTVRTVTNSDGAVVTYDRQGYVKDVSRPNIACCR